MTVSGPSTMSPQNPKRRNHEATRAYLQLWKATDSQGQAGLWFLDAARVQEGKPAKVKFEVASRRDGKERSSAAFAVEDWLYVPEDSGIRDDALEDEFSALEADMVELCRSSRVGSPGALSVEGQRRAILGCLSHAARDRYGWSALHGLVQSDPERSPTRASHFDPAAHKGLVANARRFLDHYEELVDSYTWSIFWGVPDQLIVCDRPCWDLRLRARSPLDAVFMPLSPETMLMGCREGRAGSIEFINVANRTTDMWKWWNTMTIERTRAWLLGTDSQALIGLLPEFAPEKFKARVLGDQSVGLGLQG